MIFVAAKVEECPVNAKIVLQKLNRMEGASLTPPGSSGVTMPSPALVNASAPGAVSASVFASASAPPPPAPSTTPLPFLYDMEDLLEMEFAILVGLKYDLIVYHPYRPLVQSGSTHEGEGRTVGRRRQTASRRPTSRRRQCNSLMLSFMVCTPFSHFSGSLAT